MRRLDDLWGMRKFSASEIYAVAEELEAQVISLTEPSRVGSVWQFLDGDLVKPELLFVLVRVQDLGYYAVAGDTKLTARLEAAVARIDEKELREAAQETMSWLRGVQE